MNKRERSADISKAENAGGDDPALARYVNSIENRLDDLVQLLPAPNSESTSKSELLVLAQTSSLIHNAAKIYFYTTLHSAVPSTHIVRRLVNEQVDLIKRLPKMRSAHLWSIFVTALYAFDDEQRIFFLEQFDKVKEVSATRSATQAAKSIVQTVWKNRDLEVDSEHIVKPGMSDWARFVRPMSENLSLA